MQLAWADGLVLVDPLAVDLGPLAAVLDGPGVAVMHAASQDLEMLQRSCGTILSALFEEGALRWTDLRGSGHASCPE